MDCKLPSTDLRRTGFTLVELMVASTLSAFILFAVIIFIVNISQGTMALANHVVLESKAQIAADLLSQSIRGVRRLTAYSATSLSFLDYDSNTVQVVYNPTAKTLSLTKTNVTTPLLTSCYNLQFTLLQETIASGLFDATNTTSTVNNCKMVVINWTCSTNATFAKANNTNLESLQCAKIVFRNH